MNIKIIKHIKHL